MAQGANKRRLAEAQISQAEIELEGIAAFGIARKLAEGPAFALASLKSVLRQSVGNDFDQQLDVEMASSARCCASEDYAEAVAAFVGKRKPAFRR